MSPASGPYDGLVTRTGVPEQSWVLPDRRRGAGHRPHPPRARPRTGHRGRRVSLRSGRARARLDRERSDLVATVAHELRSPLTGVKGFVPGAAQPVGPAQRRAEEADARPRSTPTPTG